MKTHEIKSTKGGTFTIELPSNFKKVKLPMFNEWVTALESGKYRQGTGSLCASANNQLKYCCLGVLCKVQGRLQKGNILYGDSVFGSTGVLDSSNPLSKILKSQGNFPEGVEVHKAVSTELGTQTRHASTFVGCNDTLLLSFKDIAKILKTIFKA